MKMALGIGNESGKNLKRLDTSMDVLGIRAFVLAGFCGRFVTVLSGLIPTARTAGYHKLCIAIR